MLVGNQIISIVAIGPRRKVRNINVISVAKIIIEKVLELYNVKSVLTDFFDQKNQLFYIFINIKVKVQESYYCRLQTRNRVILRAAILSSVAKLPRNYKMSIKTTLLELKTHQKVQPLRKQQRIVSESKQYLKIAKTNNLFGKAYHIYQRK